MKQFYIISFLLVLWVIVGQVISKEFMGNETKSTHRKNGTRKLETKFTLHTHHFGLLSCHHKQFPNFSELQQQHVISYSCQCPLRLSWGRSHHPPYSWTQTVRAHLRYAKLMAEEREQSRTPQWHLQILLRCDMSLPLQSVGPNRSCGPT